MRTLSLSTRLFLACFLASALLFAGIFFYVKGFNSQRELARAELAFDQALARYEGLLQQTDRSRASAAALLAGPDVPEKRLALAALTTTGLVPVVLRASRAESPLSLSDRDTAQLRGATDRRVQVKLGASAYLAQALETGPGDSWKLVALLPLEEFERANRELLEAFLVAGIALLFLSAVLAQMVAREIMRPLTELRNKVRDMAETVGFDPPSSGGDEISEMTRSYIDVARHLQEAFEHKKLALEELETYKSELLRSNNNLHRRLFQVKVLLSLWSERDRALDVKDFLSRFLEAVLPGLPFEYGCVIIRPMAHLRSETIFAKKIDVEHPSRGPDDTPGPEKGTQWTDIIDPQVKDFLLRESDSTMQSSTFKIGVVQGCIRPGSGPGRLTVLTLRLQQGEEPLGSVHFLTEQENPPIPSTLTEFLLSLTSQVAAQLQIQALSLTTRVDPLTRLYNRGYLNDRLREELVRSARSRQAFSLVLLDLDHFRKVNEAHGQQVADDVLRNVAALLKRCCRGSDAVCRYQGAELAILLADTPLTGAKIFAENVRKAVEAEEFALPSGKLQVTVSMGISEHPTHGSGLDELLTKAEHALAEAKESGRNTWRAAG